MNYKNFDDVKHIQLYSIFTLNVGQRDIDKRENTEIYINVKYELTSKCMSIFGICD